MFAGELGQFLYDYRTSRHVYAERKGLSSENDFEQSLGEALFDRLFERRDEAGVMRRDSGFKTCSPRSELQYREIVVAYLCSVFVDQLRYFLSLFGIGVRKPGGHALANRLITARSTESENYGG